MFVSRSTPLRRGRDLGEPIRWFAALVAASLTLLAPACTSAPELVVGADRQPNIVVFLTDDQTVEQLRVMHQVGELLVERGVSFDNAVVNYPTCCPSRATLLTGQHASNHGVLWNAGDTGGYQNFEDQDTTLPVALQAAGYRTAYIGKYLNGYGLPPEGEAIGATVAPPPGWDAYRGLISPTEVLYVAPSFSVDGRIVTYTEEDYVTDVMTDMALDVVAEAGDEPLFAVVGYPAPHAQAGVRLDEFDWSTFLPLVRERYPDLLYVPPVPAPRHVGAFAGEAYPGGPAFTEADVSDKPIPMQFPQLDERSLALIETKYQAQLESLLSVDESIGAIIDALDEIGELDDTYFVFTSDNGLIMGQHRLPPSKYFPYEEALRVPLVIAGPGVDEGSRVRSLVSNVDLAPTIAAMAGVEPLRPPDGRSVLGLLQGEEEPWDRAVFVEGYAPPTALAFTRTPPQFVGVRAATTIYIEYADGGREFYDLAADPAQLDNVVGDPAHADDVVRHRIALGELRTCAGPACASIALAAAS